MDKIIVVGDADTVLGFRLAGVSQAHAVSDAEGAEAGVGEALARSDAGILIITQEALNSLSAKTRKELSLVAKPAVVEVPGKRAADQGGESLAALIKKAMGVDLK